MVNQKSEQNKTLNKQENLKHENDTDVPLMHHGPTVHRQKTCTGALLLAGPGLLQSHCGFEERKKKSTEELLDFNFS